MKFEIDFGDDDFRTNNGDQYEPTGKYGYAADHEFYKWSSCIKEGPSAHKTIILRKLPPPEPVWRAFKSADEVPGHLIWARRIFWKEGRAPFRLWANEIELLSTGDSHTWASALDHVQLAGPDLVWRPCGVLESGQ